MNISHLKYPPLKSNIQKKLPDKLIYKTYTDYLEQTADTFIMFSTKKDSNDRAIMKCFPQLINRDGQKNVPSLYIWMLSSNCSGKGFGTAMLDFAIKYSKQIGCKGNLHLSSDVSFMPNRIPHIFYRKFGMSTKSASLDKKIDQFIAKGKNATYRDFDNVNMYYPPIKHLKDKVQSTIYKGFLFGLKAVFGIKD